MAARRLVGTNRTLTDRLFSGTNHKATSSLTITKSMFELRKLLQKYKRCNQNLNVTDEFLQKWLCLHTAQGWHWVKVLCPISHTGTSVPWPSVLWHCWLGSRKGIRPVKNWVVGCWHGYQTWREVQTYIWPSWCHCHSLSLSSVKSRLVLPFWYRLTWVVQEKGR